MNRAQQTIAKKTKVEGVGLFTGSLAGVFALGIFTRRAHGWGALVGAVTSATVLVLVQQFTNVHFFLWAGIGIVTCLAVGYMASLLLPSAVSELRGLTVFSRRAAGRSSTRLPAQDPQG